MKAVTGVAEDSEEEVQWTLSERLLSCNIDDFCYNQGGLKPSPINDACSSKFAGDSQHYTNSGFRESFGDYVSVTTPVSVQPQLFPGQQFSSLATTYYHHGYSYGLIGQVPYFEVGPNPNKYCNSLHFERNLEGPMVTTDTGRKHSHSVEPWNSVVRQKCTGTCAVQTDISIPLPPLEFGGVLEEISADCQTFKCGKRHRHVATFLISFREKTGRHIPSYSEVLSGKAKPFPPVEVNEDDEKILSVDLLSNNQFRKRHKIHGAVMDTDTYTKIVAAEKEKRQSSLKKRRNKPAKELNLVDFLLVKPNAWEKGKEREDSLVPDVQKKSQTSDIQHGNILDSSAPTFHKGKSRETPKKKLTTMRKIILREKEERTVVPREKEESTVFESNLGTNEEMTPPPSVHATASSLHSRRFQDYCTNIVTASLNTAVIRLLQELARFQDRVYLKDPAKARQKRRLVCGLREVKKFAQVEKIKFVVCAPNIDPVLSAGGLNDLLRDIISLCSEQKVPCIFALNKHKLGRTLYKPSPVSCVGIMNYQGAEDLYKDLMCQYETAKTEYEKLKFQ